MRKHLRGVPFSRSSPISVKLAASVDIGLPRVTTRQGALLDDLGALRRTLRGPSHGSTRKLAFCTGVANRASSAAALWPPTCLCVWPPAPALPQEKQSALD